MTRSPGHWGVRIWQVSKNVEGKWVDGQRADQWYRVREKSPPVLGEGGPSLIYL